MQTRSLRAFLILSAIYSSATSSTAAACSFPPVPPPTAIPRSGTANVSTATSIVVVSGASPWNLKITAGGANLPVAGVAPIGRGLDGTAASSFWRVSVLNGMLSPSSEHIVTLGATELTRFTTAAGYDKLQGTAPVLHSLALWRVRYPLAEIQSGDCVFAEYHGFLKLDWDPAVIPNTSPDATLYTLYLGPKTGGSVQSFSFTGNDNFKGQAPVGPAYTPSWPFVPELDAVREYCVTLVATGDGDIARGAMQAGPVCATVTEIVKPGAGGSPTDGGATSDGGRPLPDGGPSPDCEAVAATKNSGCSVSGHAPITVSSLVQMAFAVMLIAVWRHRRRCRTGPGSNPSC